jgi:thiosulfate/3-mercaptopyruvate sulfurtransferase
MATEGYAQPELLVETDWLAAHLDDPNLRIVDCDPIDAYSRAHIKNAIGIPAHHYIKEPGYTENPRQKPLVAPPDTMQALMQEMGIGDDNLVVAYDSNGCLWGARLWCVLNYYGHSNVKVLNGGWKKWVDEGLPVSVDRPTHPTTTLTPSVHDDLLCTLDYGRDNIGRADALYLDVRSDGEWDGSNSRGNQRVGRIPGAAHLEWLHLVTPDKYQTIKPAHELRALLEAAGATPDKEIVTY